MHTYNKYWFNLDSIQKAAGQELIKNKWSIGLKTLSLEKVLKFVGDVVH